MARGHEGKIAVVTGAAAGIGQAYAARLAQDGAHVAIADVAPGNEETASLVRAAGREALTVRCDVSSPDDVARLAREVQQKFGRADILVNNAGIYPMASFEELTLEQWRKVMAVNLEGPFLVSKAFVPGMKERRWGRFIAISSVAVLQPVDGLILSNAARTAIRGLVKSLSNEYAPYNVLVNNVCPGYTATERLQKLGFRAEGQIPLARAATPEEFANVVVFLASERASYVTGVSIAVDGGWTKAL